MTYTDFGAYSHAELRRMVQALNPGEVMAAADPWRRAADTLKAIRATLTRASTEAATSWEGSTSDAFHARMLHLAATINTTASYANDAANTLKAVSEAMAKAKRDMPEEPSGWAQVKDGVSDTVSSLFGADDEDSRTAIADQRKGEAATVLQTLAMHYRTATPMLKPPPPPGQPRPGAKDDYTDRSADDAGTSGFAGVGGFLGGIGVGNAGTGAAPVSRPREGAPADPRTGGAARSAPQMAVPSPSKEPRIPVEPGVKGGVARPLPKATPVSFGAGTVVDGAALVPPAAPASGGQPLLGGSGTSILGAPGNSSGSQSVAHSPVAQPAVPQGGPGGGTSHQSGIPQSFGQAGRQGPSAVGSGQTGPEAVRGGREAAQGRPGAGRSGTPFGAGGMPGVVGGGAVGAGSTRGRGAADGAAGRAGGTVVGVGDRSGKGGGGREAFTEGGSGLGARGRVRSEGGPGSPLTQGPMVPLGSTDRGRKDNEKRRRPDYLVEDEETWAPDDPVNPNVVE
ncbi:WXG100 family type VII secretion target [Kitasatospora sp. NPDC058115]|uniref:WXG100 family type VII secretion target n=1 Tax=Kitasatospora sp. NPDC058115 TaxID=3346347 RepID=UPI0036D91FCB